MMKLNNKDECQLILVVNEATDGEKRIIEAYTRMDQDFIIPHYLDFRETIGSSTNRGYQLADTEYLAYTDVDDTRQKWHELFDFPIVHRKWIELTGRFCYTNAPASDLYPILKYYSEIVKPRVIKLVHFPGHEALSNEATEESNVQGMCSLITDESYKYNKKVLHRGKPLYFYEAWHV